jgi:type IV secretion system protein VirB6
MSGVCPAPGPDDPLVRSLLTVVDCNVQAVAQTGYFTLFQPGGAYPAVLSALLVCYVALIGYRLLLGRSQLQITDFALTALKLGAVVALATQWSTYQTVVYRTLFFGPEQIADVMLHSLRANGSILGGDVFDGLQRAVGDLTSFSPATPPGAPAAAAAAPAGGLAAAGAGQLSTLLSKAGFDSLLLLGSAVILLISTLGVLLASKIVLGLLLALGPIFIALMLFESTRGLFEGWLRASVAFAFAPLAVTLLLGLSLTLLEPSLQQIEGMRASSSYVPGVAFAVAVLVTVTASVAAGLLIAGGMIASALHIPGGRGPGAASAPIAAAAETQTVAVQARAARTASALAAQDRREAGGRSLIASAAAAAAPAAEDRRTLPIPAERAAGAAGAPDVAARLGQEPRRGSGPRTARAGARAEAGRT